MSQRRNSVEKLEAPISNPTSKRRGYVERRNSMPEVFVVQPDVFNNIKTESIQHNLPYSSSSSSSSSFTSSSTSTSSALDLSAFQNSTSISTNPFLSMSTSTSPSPFDSPFAPSKSSTTNSSTVILSPSFDPFAVLPSSVSTSSSSSSSSSVSSNSKSTVLSTAPVTPKRSKPIQVNVFSPSFDPFAIPHTPVMSRKKSTDPSSSSSLSSSSSSSSAATTLTFDDAEDPFAVFTASASTASSISNSSSATSSSTSAIASLSVNTSFPIDLDFFWAATPTASTSASSSSSISSSSSSSSSSSFSSSSSSSGSTSSSTSTTSTDPHYSGSSVKSQLANDTILPSNSRRASMPELTMKTQMDRMKEMSMRRLESIKSPTKTNDVKSNSSTTTTTTSSTLSSTTGSSLSSMAPPTTVTSQSGKFRYKSIEEEEAEKQRAEEAKRLALEKQEQQKAQKIAELTRASNSPSPSLSPDPTTAMPSSTSLDNLKDNSHAKKPSVISVTRDPQSTHVQATATVTSAPSVAKSGYSTLDELDADPFDFSSIKNPEPQPTATVEQPKSNPKKPKDTVVIDHSVSAKDSTDLTFNSNPNSNRRSSATSSSSSSSSSSSTSTTSEEKKAESTKPKDLYPQHATISRWFRYTFHDQNSQYVPSIVVDALPYMKAGTAFVKYGRYGSPHFRTLVLSSDNRTVSYYSKKKKESFKMDCEDIDRISLGQMSPSFVFNSAPQDLSFASFSIVHTEYDKSSGKGTVCSLDLVAKDQRDFEIWVEGLKKLIQIGKQENADLSKLTALPIEISMHEPDRTTNYLDLIAHRILPLSKLDFPAQTMEQQNLLKYPKAPPVHVPLAPRYGRKLDALPHLLRGTYIFKYNENGFADFRFFRLNDKKSAVVWESYDEDRSPFTSRVDLDEIDEIYYGQTTPSFLSAEPPRELASLSFSIIYGKRQNCLNMIGINPDYFELWTEAITMLCQLQKTKGLDHVKNLDKLEIILPPAIPQDNRAQIFQRFFGNPPNSSSSSSSSS